MSALPAAFRPHYAELRTRLIRGLIAVALATVLAYACKDTLAAWCLHPLHAAHPLTDKLVYTSLPEAFLSYLKLALLAGLILSFPYLLHQVWLFVAPALMTREKHLGLQVLLCGTLLFAAGALFAFFVVLPQILHYFMAYAGSNLVPMLKFGAYLTFVARMVLAFALAFEIPFLMVMAVRTGLVGRTHFQDKRRRFYLAIAVLAFLLSAGELTATVLLSLPLVALYEAGILCCRFLGKQSTA